MANFLEEMLGKFAAEGLHPINWIYSYQAGGNCKNFLPIITGCIHTFRLWRAYHIFKLKLI
jgi:hypothetical protein